ncbi:glycoside hydrolase family 43 protein [Streptomyces spiralis]|uniref:glycoside hydrolase family 43 protein n=1 Tax=Streptomyces spiralis TaxID=66376 RepID=UPI0033C87B47
MVELPGKRRRPLLRTLAGLVTLVLALLPTVAHADRATARTAAAVGAATFTNPVRQHVSDPYVIQYGGYYYMTSTDGCDAGYLCVWKSATITGFATAEKYDVFRIPAGQSNSAEVWAPEIHYVQGRFYIYYTATSAGDGAGHRLFVLQAVGGDPAGPYTEADTGYAHGQLHESSDLWAIDPTVFAGSDGRLYIAWSGWPTANAHQQNIYLATMSDPLHISGNRVQISAPTRPWETVDLPDSPSSGTVGNFPVNEGPEVFRHGNRSYLTFSASFCGTRSYAVGLLTNTDGNLLDPSSWAKTGPVFKYHGNVLGSASFQAITSPDGNEDWFLVHSNTRGCDADRELRAQRLYWDVHDGSPLLGYPVNDGVPLDVPSGEPGSVPSADPYASGWGDAFGDAAEGDGTDGRKAGTWTVTDARTASVTSLNGVPWSQLFYAANPNYENYTVSADVRWSATGTTSSYPKYGVYASYADKDNHVEVFIDRKYGVLATHAVVQGVEQPWQNSALPAGFDPTQYHTLKVVKAGAGYTFFLDGAQAQQRTFSGTSFPVLLNGQPGLVTEDTAADYRNVTVGNTF